MSFSAASGEVGSIEHTKTATEFVQDDGVAHKH
jgi:hypothetical protein